MSRSEQELSKQPACDRSERSAYRVRPNRIIVFSRFPQPGRTKTRLIPALGPEDAARLQAEFTHQTLQTVSRSAADLGCDVEVRFTDSDAATMEELFGSGPVYRPQGDGDLGARLHESATTAFAAGVERLLLIGSDCPELTAPVLQMAIESLHTHDVVLGPAHDGGYYLIGMVAEQPRLFENIAWGSPSVCQETRQRAASLGLRVHQLPALSDVDYPEDLMVCRRLGGPFENVLPTIESRRITVVMPTLNEAAMVHESIKRLIAQPNVEVIVADGGSRDQTAELAQQAGARVVVTRPGRGRQLNAGAALASGEILVFLHADVQLPRDFAQQIRKVLAGGAVAGAFSLRLDAATRGLRLVQWGANLRSRLLQLPYGDQAIFLTARLFFEMGGFLPWPLMEDFEFCRRLRRTGRIALTPAAAIVSARRWKQYGVLRTTLVNQLCVAGYLLGVSPGRLAQWYGAARGQSRR